ncbi:FtsX-like permease family protein [bacterium]|nr:MAG: FtsX-like permease family protein [bacterium]
MLSKPALSWYFKMAWRDGRANIFRFFLFVASITVGIAALVSIQSFSDTIQESIDNQSKSLLGADLVLEQSAPFPDDIWPLFDSVFYDKSAQVRFASMVLLQRNGLSRLVQVRAFEGKFPYYGEMIFDPESKNLSTLSSNETYIDESLALVLDAQIGDSLKVGSRYFKISAIIGKIPGEAAVAAFVGPRVYIPLSQLDETNLIQKGSRITYELFFQLDGAQEFANTNEAYFKEQKIRAQTVEGRKRQLGRTLDNLYAFLNLVGFIALLLGAIGVGSSIQVYAKQKKTSIALLRCLGVSSKSALLIFVIQIGIMGLIGALVGAVLGMSLVPIFPFIFGDFLPISIQSGFSFWAILKGFSIGFNFTILFALLPLIQIRRTSPLATLCIAENPESAWKDPWHWVLVILIAFALLGFSYLQIKSAINALFFTIAMLFSFLLLTGLAKGLMWMVRRFFPSKASFTIRQGLANLYRPNNQTLLMLVSIGLGTFLISTLLLTQNQLLNELNVTSRKTDTNMVLFDVQNDQKELAEQTLIELGMPVTSTVPIVTMALESINGITIKELSEDTTRKVSRWALRREYRTSYRNRLNESEKLLSGTFVEQAELSNQPIPITIEKGLVDDLNIQLGDTLGFDVQGISIQTYLSGIREVDWQRVEPNFFVIFPSGILENAPQFWVISSRFESTEQASMAKRDLVNRIPNVSIIDLNLILDTINGIVDKVSLAIQFMALFSVMTGIIVLISSLITSRFQRIKESVLLRTIGASRKQIEQIQLSEFIFIGLLAAATGIVLAVGATWLLTQFIFKSGYSFDYITVITSFVGICVITISVGWLNTRGMLDTPPLETLRSEAE